jgi:[acyl-carrier-protein] S-malonyltransferase
MSNLAFVFPGQGAQYIGMGSDITKNFPACNKIFEQASYALGFDIKDMIFNGSEETLEITENTQPSVLTASMVCLQPLIEAGIKPDVTAGLSLGEYTALTYSGALSLKDALIIVRKRGKYMQEAVPVGTGTMAAIIGLDNDLIVKLCEEASNVGIVEAVNFNCPGQVVISGEVKAVEKAVELCKSKGARRAVVLPVSAPFHSSLLVNAGEKLACELEKIELGKLNIPVISNVTADYIDNPEEIKELLIKQVSSPIYWENSIRRMIGDGIDTFVEIGPGRVLSGFLRKIDKNVTALNIQDMNSLDNTLNILSN